MTASGFYHCSVKSVGRANGRCIVAAAAYRSGEQLVDERTGEIADYRARGGVLDSFIIAPDNAPAWTHDRARLWNGGEAAEHRANGRLATELELALPHELTAAQRKELVSPFIQEIVEKYGVAADVAIHEPGEGRDHRNIHAHVLVTNRRLDENGFVEKAAGQRKDIGLSGFAMGGDAVTEIRKDWEQRVNLAYERAGLDIEVDCRSHKERGIEQEPTRHMGPEASAMERRGVVTELGDANREIMTRNEALRERAQLEIEAVKVAAELAAAKMLAEMEAAYASTKGRRDDIRSDLEALARTAELEQRRAATGRYDDIRPDGGAEIDLAAEQAMQEARRAAAGRTDDIRPDPAMQADQTMQQAWAAAKGRVDDVRAPIFDRDAAERMADEKIVEAAIAAAQEARQQRKEARTVGTDAPTAHGSYAPLQTEEPAHEAKPEPALGKTAGDIRIAFSLSRSASELQEGLAAHGISLALTSAEEARQSERTAAFAKEVGSFARMLREGEIVAINGAGHVYRLDERITGQTRNEIEGRLTGINRSELLDIADTKEAMQEASRAAWIDQQRAAQERERLPSQIESRIAECGRQARLDVTFADSADRLAGQLKPEDEQRIRTARIYEAFAARLDEAGIAIARVTEADITAIAALREQEGFDRASGQAHRPRHFAADLVAGDMAAVTRSGDVYRISPEKIGDAKQHLSAELPGVIETRARFEIEREQKAELYAERRADNFTAQQNFAAERESQAQHAETVRDVRQFNQDVGEAVDTGFKATGGFLRGLARGVEKFLESLSDFLAPPPPPTRDQAERMARSAEEKQQAHAHQEAQAERDTGQYWLIEEARRRVAEQEREDAARAKTAAERFGTPRAQEWDNERDQGRGGYERER
jgi:hypothetical protein